MITARSKKKRPIRLFVMNAKVLKKRKKPPNFSPFTRERAMRIGFILLVFALCGVAGVEGAGYLFSNPKYAVKHIFVRGNQKMSNEEIVNISALKKGQNIFLTRIHRAASRLSQLSLIEHVSVSRFMPDMLVVEVAERTPRARLSGSRRFLADYSGVILPRASFSEPERLPLVVGVNTSGLSVGVRCSQPAMAKAMQVLQLCQSSRLSELVEVEKIDSSRVGDLRLYLKAGEYTKEGCEIPLGSSEFEQKLANLAEILDSAKKDGKKIRWADHLTLNRVVVRF